MIGEDTTRNMYSSFPEINKLCKIASRWKYIKTNKPTSFLATHLHHHLLSPDLSTCTNLGYRKRLLHSLLLQSPIPTQHPNQLPHKI